MLIEFICNNVSGFNPATGRGDPCGARLVAPEESIGDTITCKSCGNPVEVPFDSVMPKPRARSTSKQRPSVAASKSTGKKLRKKKSGGRRTRDESTLADPVGMPPDVMTFEFESGQGNQITTNLDRRCPKCKSAIVDGRCTGCRYVERQFDSARLPIDKIPVKPAGFQLYASRIFNEGVSIGAILIGVHVLTAALVIVLVACGLILGGGFGWTLLVGTAIFIAFYLALVFKGYSLARNPRAKLAWFQKPFWNLLLITARAGKWQSYDKRLKGRAVVDKRFAPVADEQLPLLAGLGKCQVLDLEGTMISDAGLRHLYGLENLQCLVVRKTNVTQEGIFRLQQANRRLWIWS